jgi:cytochrome P450
VNPPRWPGSPIVGSLVDLRGDRAELFRRAALASGGIVELVVGPRRVVVLSDPELIHELLVVRADEFVKDTRAFTMMRDVLGTGSLLSDGEVWRRQRRINQPAFRRDRLGAFAQIQVDGGEALAAAWRDRRDVEDAGADVLGATMQIAARAFLGADVAGQVDALRQAFDAVSRATTRRILSPFSTPLWVPSPTNRHLLRNRAMIEGILRGILARRRAGPPQDDLLGRLLASTDEETGTAYTDDEVLVEMKTMFLAGFETVANGLVWSVLALGRDPGWQERLAEEASNLPDGPADATWLDRLPIARRAFQETLRWRPPIWATGRSAPEDRELGPYRIRAGTWIFASPYALHHDPRFWPEPDRWDPDRFLPDAVAGRARHTYLPFGLGPRRCIGEHFALMEGPLVLATLARRIRWQALGDDVACEPIVTLRPARPVRLRVAPRGSGGPGEERPG